MENLKRNWLAVSKLTWQIWRILTRALENLKNLHFNRLLLNKVYNGWAKRSIGEFCLMVLNIDATFEGRLICAFKSDTRNLANLHRSMFESVKIGSLIGFLYPKYKIYELKICRANMCHDNEEWYKIWTGLDLSIQNWHGGFHKFWHEHSKIPKIYTLVGCFWQKYVLLELKTV